MAIMETTNTKTDTNSEVHMNSILTVSDLDVFTFGEGRDASLAALDRDGCHRVVVSGLRCSDGRTDLRRFLVVPFGHTEAGTRVKWQNADGHEWRGTVGRSGW